MSTSSPSTPRVRRSHRKLRLGCQTCKDRKIKCLETMPRCRQCCKLGRRCGYQDMNAEAKQQHMAAQKMRLMIDKCMIRGPEPDFVPPSIPPPELFDPLDFVKQALDMPPAELLADASTKFVKQLQTPLKIFCQDLPAMDPFLPSPQSPMRLYDSD